MRSVCIHKPGRVEIVEREPGKLSPGYARVQLIQGGVCGSDLAAYLGTSPMVRYPRVIGHELVGRVVQAAEDAEAWDGKTVVIEPLFPCRRCYACRIGKYNACVELKVFGVHIDGGLQEYFDVPTANLHEVPGGLTMDTAVLAEPLTIALQALFRVNLARGERVLIFGAGPIGLLALQAAVSYVGAAAFVVDVRADRLEAASRLGASETYDLSAWREEGTDPGLIEAVRAWTGGDFAHVAIEATGHPASTGAALDCLAHGGRIALIGWNQGPIPVDTVQLMRKEATVYGSRNSARMFPKALEVLAAGHIDAGAMITHRLPLDQAALGLELMQDPRAHVVKVVLTP